MRLYRDFTSQEEIDAAYRTDREVNLAAVMRRFAEGSARARAELPCRLDLPYGPTLAETLDLFPAPLPNAPVMMFIHGGYWRLGAAKDVSMLARGCVARGMAAALIGYALCPAVTIDEITRQSRAALAWLWRNAAELGIDRERIAVVGHSAGGQQVGMLVATPWRRDYGLPDDVIKGAVAVSGIFDLRPLRYSWLQPKLQLTADTIQRQSPLFHLPEYARSLIVSCGGRESAEFHRQSHDYLAAWKAGGRDGRFLAQPEADHFSAIESLAEPDGILTDALLSLIG